MHEEIRRIPQAFEKVLATLEMLQKAKVADLGIIFTLMEQNKHQLRAVQNFCRERHLNFSLNVAHDSPVYFGEGKASLKPDAASVKKDFDSIFWRQLLSLNPKNWAKAWFNEYSHLYMTTHQRPIACGAGENFFYMDSHANIFMCHFKNWPIGNLQKSMFEEIWTSAAKQGFLTPARLCQDCWMMCTAKDSIKRNKFSILASMPALIRHALS
jgi:MoaA/NifB/PqqE/SkfB family radical SAM enzyme